MKESQSLSASSNGCDILERESGSHGCATVDNLVTWNSVGEALDADCTEATNL